MKRILAFFILILFLASCGTTTKVTGVWKKHEEAFDLNRIAVIGIFPKHETRIMLEDKMEQLLVEKGINAIGGLEFLPPTAEQGSLSLEIVDGFLKAEKVDALLTVSVLDISESIQKTSGSYYYYPRNDAAWNDYYGQMQNYLYAPGYYTKSTNVFLETNLYTFPEGELIWSAQSESTNITKLETGATSVSKAVVGELLKSEVIEIQSSSKK